MDYQRAIDWLYGTQLFGMKLGLDNVWRLLTELGLYRALRGRKILHVAGTNGKGSVCAFSDAILREAGIRTGLFTSPHLVVFRERIRVDGEMISETAVADGLTAIRNLAAGWDPHPTFFEITLVLAVKHFCESGAEALVIETGMGGRLDATNALPANVSVITSIGFDHQQWLGESLREIAAEKAGILKPDTPVIIADLEPEARDAIGRTALEVGAPLIEVHPLPGDWALGIPGPHQRENAALAVEAVCRLPGHAGPTAEQIRAGLAKTRWPARFQRLGEDGRLVIDGAHNGPAIAALITTWRTAFGDERPTVIFGGVSGKDTRGILRQLSDIAARFYWVAIPSLRGLSTSEIAALWTGVLPAEPCENLAAALDAARQHSAPILITGSLFLAGAALAELGHGGEFEISEQ